MDPHNFFLKPGYQSRLQPRYFEDNTTENDGIVWQPEVYSLVKLLARQSGARRLIDLGCGRGGKLEGCSPEFELIGVDFGSNLSFCQQQYPVGRWIECDFEQCEGLAISPEEAASSVVICADVIEHLTNPYSLLDTICRLLKEGAIGVISTPERDLLRGLAHDGPPINECHVREWNLAELRLLLCSRGLRVDFAGLTSSNSLNGIKDTMLAIVSHPQRPMPECLIGLVDSAGPGNITVAGEKIMLRNSPHARYRQIGEKGPARLNRDIQNGLPVSTPDGSRRRVAFITCEVMGPHKNGGIGTAYTTLAENLAAAGHQVTLLDTAAPPPPECGRWIKHFAEKSIDYVPLPEVEIKLGGNWRTARSYRAYQWLKERKFDIIHFPEYQGEGYYTLLAKHQGLAFHETVICVGTHSPTAWCFEANRRWMTGPDDLEADFMERESVRLADVLISPSRYLLEWMGSHGWQLPVNCFVHPNLMPDSAKPLAKAVDATLKELVFFGRLESRKGVEIFCKAVERLGCFPGAANLTVTFLGKPDWVNGQPACDYITQAMAKWSGKWKILPNLDQKAALEYLRGQGRFAVIPSLLENSPYSVLECLGCGIPFVASRVGGIPELISNDDLAEATFVPEVEILAHKLQGLLGKAHQPRRSAIDNDAVRKMWLAWHESCHLPVAQPSVSAVTAASPLVSICLCTYNRPKLLAQALASLKVQDYPNFEVVLVDDGSITAEATEFLEQLAPEFEQRGWQLLRQENRYLGAARNAAAQRARGEYLLFMDDDNIARPEELSTFVRVAQRTHADIVTACFDMFTGDDVPAIDQPPIMRWLMLGAAAQVGAFRNCFGDANMLVRRDVFLALSGFAEERDHAVQDWELLARAVIQGYHLEMIPEGLFHYRVQADSMYRTMEHFGNYNRCFRPYLEVVPDSLRQMISVARASLLTLQETHPPACPPACPPSTESDHIQQVLLLYRLLTPANLRRIAENGVMPELSDWLVHLSSRPWDVAGWRALKRLSRRRRRHSAKNPD